MADCWVDRGCDLSGSTTSQTPQAVSISWGFSEIRNQEIQITNMAVSNFHTRTHTKKKHTRKDEASWTIMNHPSLKASLMVNSLTLVA